MCCCFFSSKLFFHRLVSTEGGAAKEEQASPSRASAPLLVENESTVARADRLSSSTHHPRHRRSTQTSEQDDLSNNHGFGLLLCAQVTPQTRKENRLPSTAASGHRATMTAAASGVSAGCSGDTVFCELLPDYQRPSHSTPPDSPGSAAALSLHKGL